MSDTYYWTQLRDLIKVVGGRRREEPVILATGEQTHVYLDVKGVLERGARVALAAAAFLEFIDYLGEEGAIDISRITAVGGPTMGADVISHAVVMRDYQINGGGREWKWFSVRDRRKTDHGLGQWIEGHRLSHEDTIILTDDVANSGKSLVEAAERILETGAKIAAVVPIVDRSNQTRAKIVALGLNYYPMMDSVHLGLPLLKTK